MQDGRILAEGGGLAHWDEVPRDLPVVGVTITDGQKLAETLSGFDFYVCCYEAETSIAMAGSGGDWSGLPRGTKDRSQILYGIRVPSTLKRRIRVVAHTLSEEIRKAFPDTETTNCVFRLRGKNTALENLDQALKGMLGRVEGAEVVEVSLGLRRRILRRSELNQTENSFREGSGCHEDDLPAEDNIRDELLKGGNGCR